MFLFLPLVGLHQLVNVSYLSVISGNKSIEVGSTVNVSCIVNFSSIAKLKPVGDYPLWLDNSTETPLTENDGGVVAIFEMKENNNSASRMLQLRASVINGTKWPKPFKCADKVRLPHGDEFIRYGKMFSVDFDSELHLPSVLQVCLSVCLIDCGCACLSITSIQSAHVPTCWFILCLHGLYIIVQTQQQD